MTPGPEDGSRRGGPALEAMYGLTLWLIPTLEHFPRRQKFLLGDRIRTTAVASLESLTEATFTRGRARLLDRVNLDLDKLRLLLRLAKDLRYPRPAALRARRAPPRRSGPAGGRLEAGAPWRVRLTACFRSRSTVSGK